MVKDKELILVSVVVPVFNAEKYLNRCIKSIINQTYENIEIILINDGSTDLSLNICKKWASKDSRVKVINKLNEGVSATRNLGIKESIGDYITFVDADDILKENFLEEAVKISLSDNFDVIVGGIEDNIGEKFSVKEQIIFINENKERLIKALVSGEEDKYFPYFNKGGSAYSFGRLYKSSLIKKVKYPEGIGYREDLIFNLQTFLNANKIVFAKNIWYDYLLNKDSACFKYRENYSDEAEMFIKTLKNISDSTNIKFEDEMNICIMKTYLAWLKFCVVNNNSRINFKEKIKKIRNSLKNKELKKTVKKLKFKDININYKIMVIVYRAKLSLIIYLMCSINNKKNKLKYEKI